MLIGYCHSCRHWTQHEEERLVSGPPWQRFGRCRLGYPGPMCPKWEQVYPKREPGEAVSGQPRPGDDVSRRGALPQP